MKNRILIALIIWMFISLILCVSIVGLLLFVRSDSSCQYHKGEEGRSTWCKIGYKLTEKLIG